MWKFASPPPETGVEFDYDDGTTQTIPETEACPELFQGMVNGDLYTAYIKCRAINEANRNRVKSWETWSRIERNAHDELRGLADGKRQAES